MELPEGFKIQWNKISGQYRWVDTKDGGRGVCWGTRDEAIKAARIFAEIREENWEDVTNGPS